MTNDMWAILKAWLRTFAAILVLEFLLEFATEHLFDFSVKEMLLVDRFGPGFMLTYFSVMGAGLLVMLSTYHVVRPRFSSRLRAGLFTAGLFFISALLLMIQLQNFGFVTPQFLLVSLGFNLIELPVAMAVGARSFNRVTR